MDGGRAFSFKLRPLGCICPESDAIGQFKRMFDLGLGFAAVDQTKGLQRNYPPPRLRIGWTAWLRNKKRPLRYARCPSLCVEQLCVACFLWNVVYINEFALYIMRTHNRRLETPKVLIFLLYSGLKLHFKEIITANIMIAKHSNANSKQA